MKVFTILMLAVAAISGEDTCMFTQSNCASFGPKLT